MTEIKKSCETYARPFETDYPNLHVIYFTMSLTPTYWTALNSNTRPQDTSPARFLLETFLKG